MSNPAPIDPKIHAPATSGEAAVPIVPSFEEKLRLFWQKNARTVYALTVVVLLAIIGRGALEYYERQQEAGIQSDYAAATTPEKLKSFINQNPKHTLAGVASLKLADDAYSAGNYTEAQSNFQRAADILKDGPLAGRARLGAAVTKLNIGQAAEGEEKLKLIANDVGQLKPIRAEAAYHLATIALDASRTDDAAKYLELASTVDPMGTWAQQAMMLRGSLPAPAAADVSIKVPTKP
jgi:predicted negative regulator of RcsB-dependent stress response